MFNTTKLMVAGTLLVTFFLYACASLSTVEDPPKAAAKDARSSQIKSVNSPPETTKDYYNQAFLAFDLARTQAVDERSGYYQNMLDLLEQVEVLAASEQDDEMIRNATKLRLFAWEKEHNAAIRAMQQPINNIPQTDALNEALSHASNAVFLMPDSLVSYEMLSQLHYMNEEYEESIRVIDLVLTNLNIGSADAKRLEQKRSYLLSLSTNQNKSIVIDDLPIPYKVINALLDEENWFEAINVIQAERSKKPEQKQLIHILALVHYKISEMRLDPIVQRIENSRTGTIRLSTSEKAQLNEADTHYQKAEELFNELKRSSSSFGKYDIDMTTFYRNGAIYFHQLRNTNWLPHYAFDLRVTNYANNAIEGYRAILENSPEKKEYWSNIAQLYQISGKNAEAEQAKKRAQ